MFKVELALNEEKIKSDGKYSIEKIYAAVDKTFVEEALMEKIVETDGTRVYVARKLVDNDHYSKIAVAIRTYVKQKWFVDNALKFIYGNSRGSSDPKDYKTEDILKEWGVGKSVAV